MRLQLALNVPNIDQAVDYYSLLFDTKPHKRRPGYANFAISEPPLKLVLFENRETADRLNHLGIEVLDKGQMKPTKNRLEKTGILNRVEDDTTCCHATQDKLWTDDPAGLSWEWYHITDDTGDAGRESLGKTCCV
jgi:hypothetical protein